MSTTIERIFDHVGDIWLALQGIAHELDTWNSGPRTGHILINGVKSMTTIDVTDIPDNDVPIEVQWQDRLGGVDTGVATTWLVQDANGADASNLATVTPDPNDSEKGTLTFHQPAGQFKVLAQAQGANSQTETAQTGMYNIKPGAPAVGKIVVS